MSDTVTSKLLVYKVAMLVSIVSNNFTDHFKCLTRLALIDRSVHRFSRNFRQSMDFGRYFDIIILHENHSRVVAMMALFVANNVDVEVVACLDFVSIRDTVRNYIIDAQAY